MMLTDPRRGGVARLLSRARLVVTVGAALLSAACPGGADLPSPAATSPHATAQHAYPARDFAGWQSFTSRAGWSVKYPPFWTVSSCTSCPDPTDPRVFVSLSGPSPHGGHVMIDHLTDVPRGSDVEEWLSDISRRVNLNRHITDERTAVDGRPALRVRYQHIDGTQGESLFIVDSPRTFYISFTRAWREEDDEFYTVHRQIVSTFTFTNDERDVRSR